MNHEVQRELDRKVDIWKFHSLESDVNRLKSELSQAEKTIGRLQSDIQGGIGYWQKIKLEFPDKFNRMAEMEHELTDLKGKPVTMLKDQRDGGGLIFLKPHPLYPDIKDISMMKGRPPKPLIDCNGFCGTNDLSIKKNNTQYELNFDDE